MTQQTSDKAVHLTQDAFVKAYRAYDSLEKPENARAWLYQIAHRVALDEIVRPTGTPGLSVAPATLELASTEVELFTAIGREMILRDAVGGWADRQFDVVYRQCVSGR